MLELSFDRDSRSIYCYFTDISPDEDERERELPGVWLLNAHGQIIGLRIELPAASDHFAEYALQHEGVDYSGTTLTLHFTADPVYEAVELPYGALVDLDHQGRALGLETPAMIEFSISERLEACQHLLIEVYDDHEAEEDTPESNAADVVDIPHELIVDPNEAVRAGFVALVGKPNVGKSTLLNTILGQKVSIVSPKPQTTRVPVRGILNNPTAQIIFVDTPGIHQPRHKLGSFMVEVARRAIPDADVIGFMVDISEPPNRMDREIARLVQATTQPKILLLNKVDLSTGGMDYLQAYRELGEWDAEIAISAREGLGLAAFIEQVVQLLPVGPRLYPEDQLSDMSERELVGELIREKVMLNTAQEIPHSIAVEVEEWEQRGDTLYIRANISVERDSQKGIVIGSGGVMLRKIGAAARYEIERTLGQHVYLDLWVKVRENWRQKPNQLRWLGYDVKFFRG